MVITITLEKDGVSLTRTLKGDVSVLDLEAIAEDMEDSINNLKNF